MSRNMSSNYLESHKGSQLQMDSWHEDKINLPSSHHIGKKWQNCTERELCTSCNIFDNFLLTSYNAEVL